MANLHSIEKIRILMAFSRPLLKEHLLDSILDRVPEFPAAEFQIFTYIVREYFYLGENIKPRTAVAFPEGETPLSHELIPDMIGRTSLPFDLHLRSVKLGRNDLIESTDLTNIKHLWADYQPNALAWPLMSQKMKELVELFLTGKEGIIWMKTTVRIPDDSCEYFIPQFSRKLDVLDEHRTTYADGTDFIVMPVFSLDKISEYSLFHKPGDFWQITLGMYVNENLMNAMKKEKLTGVGFSRASVAW